MTIPILFSSRKPTYQWLASSSLIPYDWTFSRAGNAMMFDETGSLVWAPSNLLVNSSMVGAVVGGVSPTGWTVFFTTTTGVTATVEATGVVDGLPYIDYRVQGTAVGSGNMQIALGLNNAASCGAVLGQSFTASMYLQLVSGTPISSSNFRLQTNEYNSSATYVSNVQSGTSTDNTLKRASHTHVISGATTAYINPRFVLTTTNGVVYDHVIRIAAPQLERTSYNSPQAFRPTSTAAYYGPRFEPEGLLMEGQRTNLIRNNTNQGGVAGSPGTPPTYTSVSAASGGLTRTISFGTEFGLPYMDVRWVGTATSAFDINCTEEGNNTLTGIAGETFTNSQYMRISAGSLNGFSGAWIKINEFTSTQTYVVGGQNAITLTSAFTRFSYTRTLTGGTTAYAQPLVTLATTNGGVIDLTLRFYGAQMEKATMASSVMLTYGSAVTRANEECSTPNLPWFNPVAGSFVVEGSSFIGASAGYGAVVALGMGASANELYANFEVGGSRAGVVCTVASVASGIYSGLPYTTGNNSKLAVAYNGVTINAVIDNATVQTMTKAMPSVTKLTLGTRNSAGSGSAFGHIKSFKYWGRALSGAELKRITT